MQIEVSAVILTGHLVCRLHAVLTFRKGAVAEEEVEEEGVVGGDGPWYHEGRLALVRALKL
jgi:hypothetical protein